MRKIDPQQELFTALRFALGALDVPVYDGFLPPEGTPYPFIYIGESQLADEPNKTAVFGTVTQTVHIWHANPKRRGMASALALTVKSLARQITRTANFSWHLMGVNQQMLSDNTTRQPLLHVVIDLDYRFN